jgi:hypothetical protein
LRRTLVSVAALGLLAVGCRTRPIPEPRNIAIPPGLSPQNVEVAILSALTNQPPPGVYRPRETMPEEA